MFETTKFLFAMLLAIPVSGVLVAQEPNPTAAPRQQTQREQSANSINDQTVPIYKVTVVARDIPAINYFHRKGATKIGFQGTSLLPNASGEAKVEAQTGRTTIDATFEHLEPANTFGPEYLTYVPGPLRPKVGPLTSARFFPVGPKTRVTSPLPQACRLSA